MFGAVIAIPLQVGHKHDVTGIPKQNGKHYMTSHVKPKPVLHTVLGFYWAVNLIWVTLCKQCISGDIKCHKKCAAWMIKNS